MGRRDLTSGEISLASSVYGDAINYSDIKIFDRAYAYIANTVTAPNGNIYYPRGSEKYASDFSTASADSGLVTV